MYNRILHTPMIYPSDYMHVNVYIHVNTCMYAKLDVVIIFMNVHSSYMTVRVHEMHGRVHPNVM